MEFFLLAVYCAAILGGSIAGGLVPLVVGLTHTRLQVYLSFSAGVMLGTALFHMLPEGVLLLGEPSAAHLQRAFVWLAGGLLCLFFVERFFAFHHHEVPTSKSHAPSAEAEVDPHGHAKFADLAWGPATVGLCLHTLAGGVALASAVAAGDAPGLLGFWVFVAIFLHKPADSLTIVTLMLGGGATRRRAHLVNLGFAMMVPLGAALFLVFRGALAAGLESSFTGSALAFSAGTFLCVALSDLLPELQFHEHDRLKLSAALLMGIVLMFLAARMHS